MTELPLIPFLSNTGPVAETESELMLDLSLSFAPTKPAQFAIATTSSTTIVPQSVALQSVLSAMTILSQTLTTHIVKVNTGIVEMRSDISTLFDAVKEGEEKKKEEETAI